MGSRSIPVQDGKPLWQSSSLLFQCQLRVPLIKNWWSWGYTRKPQSCVMTQEESCMPEFTPTGKWTDLQSYLTCNRRYVNVLQDDNKNRKTLQTIPWVAILRQKHLYLSIQFFFKSRLSVHYLKKDITTLMKKIYKWFIGNKWPFG